MARRKALVDAVCGGDSDASTTLPLVDTSEPLLDFATRAPCIEPFEDGGELPGSALAVRVADVDDATDVVAERCVSAPLEAPRRGNDEAVRADTGVWGLGSGVVVAGGGDGSDLRGLRRGTNGSNLGEGGRFICGACA